MDDHTQNVSGSAMNIPMSPGTMDISEGSRMGCSNGSGDEPGRGQTQSQDYHLGHSFIHHYPSHHDSSRPQDNMSREPSRASEFEEKLRSPSPSSVVSHRTDRMSTSLLPSHHFYEQAPKLWARFRGKNRDIPSLVESACNTAKSNRLNLLLIFIPFAWTSHYAWQNDTLTFALCFLGIIPLESLFEFGGAQMAYYVGRELGELVIITMNNTVEATLAIVLLRKCELRILQATIVGVVLLHLLLVPGTAFLIGGARIQEQNLLPASAQLNSSLLTIGVLTMLIPSAFFSALDYGQTENGYVNDATRDTFAKMSHGLAIILLIVYVTSRIFLHNPPGDATALAPAPDAPIEIHEEEARLLRERPKVTSGFCLLLLVTTIAVLAITAEMLVTSIEHVRMDGNIGEEWFGMVLLPIASFSVDGVVTIVYFVRAMLCVKDNEPPATIAKSRAIDLSVQFILFWLPCLVLLGWALGKPLIFLFDLYEVAVILGAIFLVNYVIADSKTNWAEGCMLVAFYFMIVLCTWFYPGQATVESMLSCGKVAVLVNGTAVLDAASGGA